MLGNGGDDNSKNTGLSLLRRLLCHTDPGVMSQSLVVAVHLLWDPELQQLIGHMPSPSIAHMAARWAVAAIESIQRTFYQRRENSQLATYLGFAREKAGITALTEIELQQERELKKNTPKAALSRHR